MIHLNFLKYTFLGNSVESYLWFVGILIFGTDNFISVELVAITGAITGYFIIKANLNKRPDAIDEIDQIGNDLY